MQGFRMEMEDDHTIQLSLTKRANQAFFGVYDGHNGEICAHWSAQNLWKYIDNLEDQNEQAIQEACLAADKDFLTNDPNSAPGMGGGSGCTAVFVIADTATEGGYKLTVGNIGDSRALIGRAGQTIALTDDHKPGNPIELERIRNAGGFVESSRVDGQLALSRAMGDSQYKSNQQLPAHQQKVIPVPDITQEVLGPNDFLLICCDGIFESFTNDQAVQFVANALKKTDDLAMIMADLLDAVLVAGSKDNMTAMIVLPQNGESYHQDKEEFLPGAFHQNKTDRSFVEAYTKDAERNGFTLDAAIKLLDENTESGKYKPVTIASRGFFFPFFAAAAASNPKDDNDDIDEIN